MSSSPSPSPPNSDKINGNNGEENEKGKNGLVAENGEQCQEEEQLDQFAREFLQRHNELRKLHGSPELVLSPELCSMAKEWAHRIAWKGHVSFAENSGIGENITVFPEGKSAREMVDYWYEENRKYEYDAPGWQEGTNYFSQIVWRSTKEIGVSLVRMQRFPLLLEKEQQKVAEKTNGVQRQQQRSVAVVVAFYRPAGNSNRSGQFMLNVSKPNL